MVSKGGEELSSVKGVRSRRYPSPTGFGVCPAPHCHPLSVADGRIVRANRSVCRLLGYTHLELLTKHRGDIFRVTNTGDAELIQKNGKYIPCEVASSVIRDVNGVSNALSTISVKAKGPHSKPAIAQSKTNDWINSIVKISYDVICDWDLVTDLIAFGSNSMRVYSDTNCQSKRSALQEWIELFPTDDRALIENKLNLILGVRKHELGICLSVQMSRWVVLASHGS